MSKHYHNFHLFVSLFLGYGVVMLIEQKPHNSLLPCNMASSSSACRCSFADLSVSRNRVWHTDFRSPPSSLSANTFTWFFSSLSRCFWARRVRDSKCWRGLPPLLVSRSLSSPNDFLFSSWSSRSWSKQWALNESRITCLPQPLLGHSRGRHCRADKKALAGEMRSSGPQRKLQAGQWGPRT